MDGSAEMHGRVSLPARRRPRLAGCRRHDHQTGARPKGMMSPQLACGLLEVVADAGLA